MLTKEQMAKQHAMCRGCGQEAVLDPVGTGVYCSGWECACRTLNAMPGATFPPASCGPALPASPA